MPRRSPLRFSRTTLAHGSAILRLCAGRWRPGHVPGALRAEEAASPWFTTEQGRVRLIAAEPSVGSADTVRLGLQFELAPHWKIYWRSPGDAGYPPHARLDGLGEPRRRRDCLAGAERFTVLGLETMGYENAVVLPITARLAKPGRAASSCARRSDTSPARSSAFPTRRRSPSICRRDRRPADRRPWRAHRALSREGAGRRQRQRGCVSRARAWRPGCQAGPDPGARRRPAARASRRLRRRARRRRLRRAASWCWTIPRHPPARAAASFGDRPDVARLARPTTWWSPWSTAAARWRPRRSRSRVPAAAGARGAACPMMLDGAARRLDPQSHALRAAGAVAEAAGRGRSRSRRHRGALRRGFLASVRGHPAVVPRARGRHDRAARRAASSVGWGMQFQQPLFLAGMAALTTLFAANLWGWFEMPLPRFIADRARRRRMEARSPAMSPTGAFATLLATPCSAPFLGTAIGFALAGAEPRHPRDLRGARHRPGAALSRRGAGARRGALAAAAGRAG